MDGRSLLLRDRAAAATCGELALFEVQYRRHVVGKLPPPPCLSCKGRLQVAGGSLVLGSWGRKDSEQPHTFSS